MNGSSGFRGVPMTGGGTGGSSSSGNHHNSANEMNSALRSHHPSASAGYFPRLESLTSPLYNAGELTPAGVAAAAAASRLFPAAHLSALHAAAVAAASNVPQTTSHHGMPPPSLTQFHQAAAAAAAAANHHSVAAAHHSLLSPFLYPHLSAASAYNNQPGSTVGSGLPPPFAGHPRHLYGSTMESAFIPASNVVPRYRYMLPSTTTPSSAPVQGPPRFTNTTLPTTLDRSLSESEYASAAAAAIAKARRPSSPNRMIPSTVANVPTSAASIGTAESNWSSINRSLLKSDQRKSAAASSTVGRTSATSPEMRTSGTSDSKKPPQKISGLPTQPYYPSHFMKGTVIQLANGELKRVEDLNTEDFVRSAHLTSELKIDTSQVVKIEEKSGDIVMLTFSVGGNKVQVSVEATVEHPFFVIGQGWSSFSPDRTKNLYGLPCQRLQVGDVCISLTHRDVAARAAASSVSTSVTNANTTPSTASSSGSTLYTVGGVGQRSQVSSSTAPIVGHPTSTKFVDQSILSNVKNRTADGGGGENIINASIRRSCNEDEERSRKKRKMTLPVRIGSQSTTRFGSPSWNLRHFGERLAMTPPPGSSNSYCNEKSSKTRRWSVS